MQSFPSSIQEMKYSVVKKNFHGRPFFPVLERKVYANQLQWDAFAEFILRTWFQRIWVVQETWAARNVVVFCGDNMIMCNQITAAIQALIATKSLLPAACGHLVHGWQIYSVKMRDICYPQIRREDGGYQHYLPC